MRVNLGTSEFLVLLQELDAELERVRYSGKIEICAQGAFALMWRDIGDVAGTGEIDTATANYAPAVDKAIERVGAKHGIKWCWLGNENLAKRYDGYVSQRDIAQYREMHDERYERVATGLGHIDLQIADVATLVRGKADAIAAREGTPCTKKDLVDFAKLLVYEGCETVSQAKALHPWLKEPKYKACANHLSTLEMFSKGKIGDPAKLRAERARAREAKASTPLPSRSFQVAGKRS